MSTVAAAMRSSLGKKYLMGLTGLIWVGFVLGHLVGNFLLFAGREPFNNYAYFLETVGHGKAVYLAEAFLVFALLVHVYNGFAVIRDARHARQIGYEAKGNAGGTSRKTFSSQSMIVTGVLILAFLGLHLYNFKFAPGTRIVHGGNEMRDLYGIVIDRFSDLPYVAFYMFVMVLLGIHLRHGVWSGFQSLGLLNHKTYPAMVNIAAVLAVLLAIGFLLLPLVIYLNHAQFATPDGGLF